MCEMCHKLIVEGGISYYLQKIEVIELPDLCAALENGR